MAQKRSGLKQALSETKRALAAARAKLESASADQQRMPLLAAKLEEKMADICKRAAPLNQAVDACRLDQLVHETAEQREIEEIRRQRKEAEAEIRDLRQRARLQLVQLAGRSDATGAATTRIMNLLDSLSPHTSVETTDAIIGLLSQALGVSTATKCKPNEPLEDVKRDIRLWKNERSSYQEICNRLGNRPRPLGATWRHLPWPKAYHQHRNAVMKWMSKQTNG